MWFGKPNRKGPGHGDSRKKKEIVQNIDIIR